jgi:hypothetical protein
VSGFEVDYNRDSLPEGYCHEFAQGNGYTVHTRPIITQMTYSLDSAGNVTNILEAGREGSA